MLDVSSNRVSKVEHLHGLTQLQDVHYPACHSNWWNLHVMNAPPSLPPLPNP